MGGNFSAQMFFLFLFFEKLRIKRDRDIMKAQPVFNICFFSWKIFRSRRRGQRIGSVFSVNRWWMFLLMNALVVVVDILFWFFSSFLYYHSHLFLQFFLVYNHSDLITLIWATQQHAIFSWKFFLVFGDVNGFMVGYIIFIGGWVIDVSFKFRRCPLSWLWNGHVNRLLAGSSEEN